MELKIYEVVNQQYNIGDDGTAEFDIPYAAHSEKNKLDLYIPTIKRERYPLVVFIHGGAFFKSSKERHLSNILNCLLYGYAVASINYRFNDEAAYPEIRMDCIEAFNFLAARPEIDDKKIVLWGESHGAYLADDITVSCSHMLQFKPAGIVSFYAPIDLKDFYLYKEEHHEHVMVDGYENDSVTFRAEGDSLLKEMEKYAVLKNISGQEPPFYLLHGKQDDTIPYRYTKEFDRALAEKKVEHVTDIVEDGIHGIDFYASPKYNAPVLRFIESVMEGGR